MHLTDFFSTEDLFHDTLSFYLEVRFLVNDELWSASPIRFHRSFIWTLRRPLGRFITIDGGIITAKKTLDMDPLDFSEQLVRYWK